MKFLKCITMIFTREVHVLLLFCAFSVRSSAEASSSEESKCNTFISTGFNYGHFFKISDLKAVRSGGISFRFRVKTPSDAHIKFSERPYSRAQEPAYEVVIGAGKNSFSFIRRREEDLSKIRLDTPDFLSPDEARGFWIWISNSGRIEVGKEGDVLPFMLWEDNNRLDIKYFSFSSWNNINAEWYYNCSQYKGYHLKDQGGDLVNFLFGSGNGDTEIEPPIIDTNVSNFTNVFTHLSCNHIHLDDRRSILVVDGVLSLLWEDKRKVWSPKEFRNRQYLDWHSYGIWTPSVMLLNTADHKMGNKKRRNSKVRIYPNGTLLWKYPVYFSAFCKGIDYHNWPMDSHVCELQLGLRPPHSSLRMILLKGGINLQESMIHTGWHITKVNATAKWIPSLIESTHKNLDNIRSPELDHIIFEISLTRSNNIYHTALIISLVAISMLILSSFWASPLGSVKIGLQCISLMITSLSLLFCWKMIPVQSYGNLPTIFSAFVIIMHMVWIAIVSSVVTSSFVFSAPARVQSSVSGFLKSKFLAMLFCLPQPSNKVVECYSQLSDGRPMSKEDPHGYSFMSNESESQWNWILISIATDRILFCVYTALLAYLFSMCAHRC